ncbi:hypothetical protein B0H16DRAFT_1701012 [Mycena metata]|uniref:Uncharacterized protein n=1 Tax=Mycena metata TaxID=1033252 RepID=A0AAD7MHN4_9AGAR|nr:hypothetical protein B0H16DRAFT_1701012 [Mycena metata]
MMSRLTRNVLRLSSSTMSTIAPPSPQPIQPGVVHSAATYSSAKVLEELLHKDYVSHHCFFNDLGFHNHLPHHLVAAYDMGAPPALLKLIYEDLAPTLRPINRQGEDITEANWITRLGERKAYGSYLAFFADQISKNGIDEIGTIHTFKARHIHFTPDTFSSNPTHSTKPDTLPSCVRGTGPLFLTVPKVNTNAF